MTLQTSWNQSDINMDIHDIEYQQVKRIRDDLEKEFEAMMEKFGKRPGKYMAPAYMSFLCDNIAHFLSIAPERIGNELKMTILDVFETHRKGGKR